MIDGPHGSATKPCRHRPNWSPQKSAGPKVYLARLADKINAFVLIKAEKVPPATEILGFINPLENFNRKASVRQSILIVRRINSHMVILTKGLFSCSFSCY
jgi:hypothetical protein